MGYDLVFSGNFFLKDIFGEGNGYDWFIKTLSNLYV